MSTVSQKVRVRFAPSPTGHLHIGGLRTALFNMLFARHYGGIFLVRIEDTDMQRSRQEFTDSILESLSWAEVMPDEPMVTQSEHFDQHTVVLQTMLKNGTAYPCICAPEEIIERQREFLEGEYMYGKYDGHCRSKMMGVIPDQPYVVRFALPTDIKHITFDDLIRGPVTFDSDQFDDFIIARSDKRPMYNFVVTVDDADMGITHVIRGEDHISNTPKQILLYQACGYSVPKFAHLPLILGPSGDRLSKRDAATSVLEYKHGGYLPAGLLNYLARLGWSHGDQEIFTRDEMIKHFSLETVGKKGAVFDPKKLAWVNSMHIRSLSAADLAHYINTHMQSETPALSSVWDATVLHALIDLYKERVTTVIELIDQLTSLAQIPTVYDADDLTTWVTADTRQHLQTVLQTLEALSSFSVELVTQELKNTAKTLGVKLVTIAQPIRIALVGKAASPGIFALMALLGKQRVCIRIRALLDALVK